MTTVEITRPLFKPSRMDPCFCGSGRRFKACCGTMAEPRDPPHGIHLVPRFLPAQLCQEWVRQLESHPRQALGVHNLSEVEPAGLGREKISGRITDKVEQGNLSGDIVACVQRAFEVVIPGKLGRNIAWFENPQVLRYEPGGLYGPHADSDHFIPEEGTWKKVIDRDVSILLYLNQEFEGGELSFRQFNYVYRPKTGDLLFFPSHGQYAHQALPIKLGIRYVIVSWAAFRDEPRVLNLRPSDCIELPA